MTRKLGARLWRVLPLYMPLLCPLNELTAFRFYSYCSAHVPIAAKRQHPHGQQATVMTSS